MRSIGISHRAGTETRPYGVYDGLTSRLDPARSMIRIEKESSYELSFSMVPVTGVARLRAERWSALTATGSHSLPTLRPRSVINTHKQKRPLLGSFLFVVPVTGVEPVQCCHRRIFSPLRLPVPPHRLLYAGADAPTYLILLCFRRH